MSLKGLLTRLQKAAELFEGGLLVVMLLSMITLAVVQIIMRNAFDTGIVWNEAMVRVLVLWVAFLGAMIGSRKGEHISIGLVSNYLPSQYQQLSQRVVNIASAIICLMAAWFCLQFVIVEYQDGTRAFAQAPAWLCEAILPVGFFVLAIRIFVSAILKPSSDNES